MFRRRRKRLSNHPDGIGELISARTDARMYLEILSSLPTRGRTLLLCLTTSEPYTSKQDGRGKGGSVLWLQIWKNTGLAKGWNISNCCCLVISIQSPACWKGQNEVDWIHSETRHSLTSTGALLTWLAQTATNRRQSGILIWWSRLSWATLFGTQSYQGVLNELTVALFSCFNLRFFCFVRWSKRGDGSTPRNVLCRQFVPVCNRLCRNMRCWWAELKLRKINKYHCGCLCEAPVRRRPLADSYKQTESVGDEDVQFESKLNAECWMLNAEEVLRTNTRGGANGMVEHKKRKFN